MPENIVDKFTDCCIAVPSDVAVVNYGDEVQIRIKEAHFGEAYANFDKVLLDRLIAALQTARKEME